MTQFIEDVDDLVPLGPPFAVDAVALSQHGQPPTLAQCGAGLRKLCQISDGIRYWRGDLMNLTEGLFKEEAAQVVDHELLSEADAKAERWVAAHVAPTARSHAPTWEHARAVAALTPAKQIDWLDKARAEDWTARKLSTEIAQATSDGKTVLRWTLVVDCQTEAKMDKLAAHAESEGLTVLKKQGVPRKVRKAKKAKKQVTAKRRGPAKMNSRRRVPR
jgi:hypothetical protein